MSIIHPATMRSISLTPPAADDKPYWPSKQCGCHVQGDEWLLCSYHEGYEDGIEAALTGGTEAAIEEVKAAVQCLLDSGDITPQGARLLATILGGDDE